MNHGIIRVLAGITILGGAVATRGQAADQQQNGCNGETVTYNIAGLGEDWQEWWEDPPTTCPGAPGIVCMMLGGCDDPPNHVECDDVAGTITCHWLP